MIFFHRSYWDNYKLRQEIGSLKSARILEQNILAENERLRQTLGLRDAVSYQTIIADVIARDFDAFRPYLIIDRGEKSGVRKYAPVITSAGLVGKILETGNFASKVMLINDPDLSVPAKNSRTGEEGVVSGTLDGRCKLRFLDKDSDIHEGDIIVTSGLNMTYPKNIVIGRARWVSMESTGLGKTALVEPAAKISSLEEVLVVKQ